MGNEGKSILKVLTHSFDVDGDIQNFDDIMQAFSDYIRDETRFLNFEYNNQSNFKSKAVTNLIINVKQSFSGIDSYPIVFALKGLSLGNQSLNIISFEVETSEKTENEPVHDHYKLQIYNPTDVDIVSDIKLQLICKGNYES